MAKKILTSTRKDSWKISTNRFVAYIDIMGFKDMISRTLHNDIYKMMKNIDENRRFNEDFAGKGSLKLIKTTTYSDSIMIYSKDDRILSLYSIIEAASGLINDLLAAGIPNKGAVAFGRMTLDFDNSIFLDNL